MNLTPTQAALLQRGLTHLLRHPDHVLESDLKRVIWVLASMATRSLAAEATATGSQDLTALQTASDMAQQAEPPPIWISLRAASNRWGIPIATLRYHVVRGHIEAHKPDGRTWLVDAHDLTLWLSERSERSE